ncbi:MAG TPA: hypothetical protein VII73_12330 [Caulobacteraceae bacterium]
MSPDQIGAARNFVLCNGRLLERRLFAFHFDGGSAEAAVAALAAYQNLDGGFGAGLEPDKRDPASQPVDVQFALETLDGLGVMGGPMVLRACDWLSSVTTKDGGVPFALPSVNAAPHAPWWAVAEDAPPAQINPTAAIAGLLLKHGIVHPWLDEATVFCWRSIEAGARAEFHDLMPMIAFLENAADRGRADAALAQIAKVIMAPGVVALETDAQGYVHKPLEWAPRPESFCRALFDDRVLDAHLDALAARQQADGGWPIFWEPISQGVALEWRGVATLQALRTLSAYGR